MHAQPLLLSTFLIRDIDLSQLMNLQGHNLNYSKSIVYMRVHSWHCIFYGFEQTYNDMFPSLCIIQNTFTALKIIYNLHSHPSLPSAPGNH